MRTRSFLGLIILLAAISTSARQAHAGLRICNQGNIKFSSAVGYVDRQKGWVAHGWLTIDPGECKYALSFPLDNRFYYYYARGRDENEHITYSGENAFCIETRKFKIYQSNYGKSTDEDCAKDGYRSAKFRKVDVSGKPEYTINLGGADNPPGPGPDPSLANAKPATAPEPPPPVRQPPAQQTPVANAPPPAQQPAAAQPPTASTEPSMDPPRKRPRYQEQEQPYGGKQYGGQQYDPQTADPSDPPRRKRQRSNPEQDPQSPPPSNAQQAAPPSGQGGGPNGTACQRFPNLC